MAFTSFKNITEVVSKYQIYYGIDGFIPEGFENVREPSQNLTDTLEFNLREAVYDISEAALCETIIYPILNDVWRNYTKELALWSHTILEADEELNGVPDYLLAKKSELGRILGLPLLTAVEAKKDNFTEGWTQCVAQLVAMQKINTVEKKYTLFGIVTNGEQWEFAQFDGKNLIRNTVAFSVFDLNRLYAALDFIFQQCQQQVVN